MKKIIVLLFIVITSHGQAKKSTLARADSLFQVGDFKTARELYSKILKDTSRNACAWLRCGQANLNLKNFDQAQRYFNKALSAEAGSSHPNECICRACANLFRKKAIFTL